MVDYQGGGFQGSLKGFEEGRDGVACFIPALPSIASIASIETRKRSSVMISGGASAESSDASASSRHFRVALRHLRRLCHFCIFLGWVEDRVGSGVVGEVGLEVEISVSNAAILGRSPAHDFCRPLLLTTLDFSDDPRRGLHVPASGKPQLPSGRGSHTALPARSSVCGCGEDL